jgi:hypothetical protein
VASRLRRRVSRHEGGASSQRTGRGG